MGKAKKIGIAIPVLLMLFMVVVVGSSDPIQSKGAEINASMKSHEEMSGSELFEITVQHEFKDLMRNSDGYVGKIIFVEGVVTNVQRDLNSINLCVDGETVSFYCDEFMFVKVNGIDTWLEEDNLAGYVEVQGISETFRTNVFGGGESVGTGDYVPQVKEIRLTCSNC